jgi:hypothetical protein
MPKKKQTSIGGAAGTPAAKKKAGRAKGARKPALIMPLAVARRLAGDLYEAAGLDIWNGAMERADEARRAEITALQEAVCTAADLFKSAKSAPARRLRLFMVACFDRKGAPDTPPRFITASSEQEAVTIWKTAAKNEFGRRKPRAVKIPDARETPGLHD